ncbi:ATP-binding cassette domain-containing protein [Streptomyces sp. NPDC056670]|uniref:ATP-binding cassette domain-containing protein n=1 Tax=Streptomyces sp. NPDC056670 TaxID=3345904 RepID=UPI003677196A
MSTTRALRGAGRRYSLGGPWVLRGIDLDLAEGALVRVEGTNGTGKSTLLRLIAGIDAPTEGRVTGRPRTAYVPERFPVALPFTTAGYLTHLGRVHGLARRTARERAGQWLERFGAAGHAGTPLAELSKGTSQRVAVAQAMLADPELLVLDEAWTGLDTAARAELDRAVRERVTRGATVVFVDHDPARLTGQEDARYALAGAGLCPVPTDAGAGLCPAQEASPAATVLVDITGTGPLPPQLPGSPQELTASGDSRTLRVPAERSDELLRALLAARPPWHIRGVRGA